MSSVPVRRRRTALGVIVAGAMVATPVAAAVPQSSVPAGTVNQVPTADGPDFAPLVTDEDPAFELIDSDLEFILDQIEISEAHAYAQITNDNGYSLLCPTNDDTSGKCVRDPMLPHGLRTVDGSFNNLEFDTTIGKSNELMPRLVPINWRQAGEALPPATPPAQGPPQNPPGATDMCEGSNTCYEQTNGFVYDAEARVISNLIVDNSDNNPTVLDAAANNDGAVIDPDTGELYLPNTTADEGLSAPVNMWFVFFGQFFDHGLDQVNKGGNGTIIVPLAEDDPLYATTPPELRFMALTRATNVAGDDGVIGTADDVREHANRTTPWVDQNQTYTSHPAHQVFIREYAGGESGNLHATGRLLNGADQDGDGERDGLPTWNDIKAQARDQLGIDLVDRDVLAVPQMVVDYYGNFVPGPNGYPQMMTSAGVVEGDPAAPRSTANAVRLDQAFLDDIANGAVPDPNADPNAPPGYDNVLLGEHFVTGDGRGNENIGLTAVHHVFHAEHNRLLGDIMETLDANPDLKAAYESSGELDDWSYEERLFQAARFGTEMQYQHLVFEEFARTVQPQIDAVVFNENAYDSTIDASIKAEFAHVVYRFGHSMLTEDIHREGFGAEPAALLDGFLNPVAFHCRVQPDINNECPNPAVNLMTTEEAAGAIVNGTTNQAANQIDELVTSTLRNSLLGLPLDLATINIIRGRDTGMPSLQQARRTFYAETGNPNLEPYSSWEDFGLALRNGNNFGRGESTSSLVNFVAAYGTHPTIEAQTTVVGRRQAAEVLVNGVATTDIVERIAGANRYETAAQISRNNYQTASVVYVSNSTSPIDSLTSGPAAAARNAPLLFVGQNSIPQATALELFRLKPERIVVLGGTGVISTQVANSLETYTTTNTVTRLSGPSRYDTAAAISLDAFPTADAVYIANGFSFVDALPGGAAAAAEDAPMLLVNGSTVPNATQAELERLTPSKIVLLGGSSIITPAVESMLATYLADGGQIVRLSGANRYETAVSISDSFATVGGGTVYLATGQDFPDALAAAPVAGLQGAPILLMPRSDALPNSTRDELLRLDPGRVVILGGEGVITLVQEALIEALFPDPEAPGDRQAFMRSTGTWASEAGITTTGLEEVDFWTGGLAEALDPFGGMLGSTFNHVFEQQLEDLQFGDRFYYLFRNQGEQLFGALEANSFSSLIQRNTDASLLPGDIFLTHDPYIDLENLPDPWPEGLIQLASGLWRWDGDEHIEIHGFRTDPDLIQGGQGDDSIWGYGGNDRIHGGSGNDTIVGGPGDDIIQDSFGDDNIKGTQGHDAIDGGTGADLLLGGAGNDYVSKSGDNAAGATGFLGTGSDIFVGGSGRDNPFGNEDDDWLEGGAHADLLMGDNGQQFQNDVDGGNDILIGGPGSDDMDAEGGDDIMVGGIGGTDRYHGMFGFDYVTYYGANTGVDADLNFNLLQPPDVTAVRDRFLQVEALSGGDHNDVIRGLGVSPDDLADDAVNKMDDEGLAMIDGLEEILRPPAAVQDYALRFHIDDPLLQDNDGVSTLLFGGSGNDVLEGRFGDDFIDGDAAIRVQLEANGVRYDNAGQLKTLVFNGTVNPGDITFHREIVVADDAGSDTDTAVYQDPFLNEEGVPNYTIKHLHDTYYEVVHVGGPEFEESEGQDILRNIEVIQFGDGGCFLLSEDTENLEPCPSLGFVEFEGQTNPPTENQAIIATVHFEDEAGEPSVANPTSIRFNWQAGEVGEAWDPASSGDSLPDAPNGRVDTFTPGDGEAGAILRVVVTFHDDNGVLRQIASEVVGGPANLAVVNVNDEPYGLTINNTAPVVGSALVPSGFYDDDGLEESVEGGMTYEWQTMESGGAWNTVATRVTPDTFLLGYTVQPADLGKPIRVQVSYTDDQGTDEVIISPPTDPVAAGL
ncbi:cell wall-binding repeat-containing protein [Ornithinimicrobium sp. F0845]|uniref:peroxidase family protein n=1 Tax=Ornithinimicrobium sp. F0845 TaxID=2926412 RepID=UPI001FF0F915|nr:peroxidase family protein [Ornithinimicrobium sp. F0845]MCK0110841.1 cell wall-binding repeat-containing protein [Ornithinimicrobium sp. F0845]